VTGAIASERSVPGAIFSHLWPAFWRISMFTSRRPQERSRIQSGFTLVELLVVIGIIALLISILLPSLSKAREHGNTLKCLSNMRQIAQAAAAYSSANKNYLLPADVMDQHFPTNLSYQDVHETWATILVSDKYLPYPTATSTAIPPGDDNVFRCPTGVLEMSAITYNNASLPSSRTDGQGAMASCQTSVRLNPGMNVFTWYGINSTNSSVPTPYTRWIISSGGKLTGTSKTSRIKYPTDYVFIFDGLYGFNYCSTNANRINARHGNKKLTNCAFADGHAETIPTTNIPGEVGKAQTADFSVANCRKYVFPKWRLDQEP
jgi:prepilin-type N-terminal cleavage/methylation domain-containing protein/prepilin-type processing-associated H-X9-DG protein